ncbi:hypothetical protein CC80DRAFT_549958 [Byssothecium circinans]|uniref:Uncharacterized protein n=1 Tax=Byssothecium circinans TaxID=147558 RepID=A0A6A5TQT0_9PLEO|nr:hypothetical protein CC80DRAFT_549958 [Byssothecium circinans]
MKFSPSILALAFAATATSLATPLEARQPGDHTTIHLYENNDFMGAVWDKDAIWNQCYNITDPGVQNKVSSLQTNDNAQCSLWE